MSQATFARHHRTLLLTIATLPSHLWLEVGYIGSTGAAILFLPKVRSPARHLIQRVEHAMLTRPLYFVHIHCIQTAHQFQIGIQSRHLANDTRLIQFLIIHPTLLLYQLTHSDTLTGCLLLTIEGIGTLLKILTTQSLLVLSNLNGTVVGTILIPGAEVMHLTHQMRWPCRDNAITQIITSLHLRSNEGAMKLHAGHKVLAILLQPSIPNSQRLYKLEILFFHIFMIL